MNQKGLSPVRSRVGNIADFLKEPMTIEEFRSFILTNIFEESSEIPEYVLTDEDWEKIHKISEERYQQWDWNYGKSPKFNVQASKRFPVGSIDLRLEVNKGKIENCKIYGDFFGVGDVADLEQKLIGARYEKEAVAAVLEEVDVQHYFGNVTKDDVLQLVF